MKKAIMIAGLLMALALPSYARDRSTNVGESAALAGIGTLVLATGLNKGFGVDRTESIMYSSIGMLAISLGMHFADARDGDLEGSLYGAGAGVATSFIVLSF